METALTPDAAGEIQAAERAEILIERLRAPDFRSARMATLTRNPLLLTNLCLVHRDRGGMLPQGRHRLYEECVEVLLERWREAKFCKNGQSLPILVSAEIGRQALQPVALWLHAQNGRTRASAEELAPVLTPALQAARWEDGDARRFLRVLRDESGLLTGWSHERYGFMHLGFQEYLAAREVRRLAMEQAFRGERQALADLAEHYGESWWQEVILLLLAQGDPPLFAPFMAEALKRPQFAQDTAFLELLLEEAAEVVPDPFLAFLQDLSAGEALPPGNRAAALSVARRLAPDRIAERFAPTAGRIEGADRRDRAAQDTIRTADGGVELVYLPGGRFLMGSPEGAGDEDEHPAHETSIRPFYLGRYPVTNEEYARFLQANPKEKEPTLWADRRFNQARQPVVGVDWEQARSFARWAGGRLPSEAEWEYAVRAGTVTKYFWGDSAAEADAYAWHQDNAGGVTHPVGEKRPNAFGLHDMAGNVWEWTQDRWHNDYRGAPADGSAWEDGSELRRAVRGGSWFINPQFLRSALRFRYGPNDAFDLLGFRLARDV